MFAWTHAEIDSGGRFNRDVTFAHFFLKLNGILAFWIAYVLLPLGASVGDFMSQPHRLGGVGLGTTITSAIFLTGILGCHLPGNQ